MKDKEGLVCFSPAGLKELDMVSNRCLISNIFKSLGFLTVISFGKFDFVSQRSMWQGQPGSVTIIFC